MKTKVHKHLPSNRWSITQGGRVVGYADTCVMVDVKPHMNLNIKAKHSHKRTVHCWTIGTLTAVVGFTPLKGRNVVVSPGSTVNVSQVVRYNPFRDETLVYLDSGEEYTGSEQALFEHNGLMTV